MHSTSEPGGARGRLRTAALLPVAVVAWLTLATGAAMAAPSAHAAAAAAAATTSMPADTGQVNGNGNGNANGQDNGKANGKSSDDVTPSASSVDAVSAAVAAPSVSSDASGGSSDHSSGNAGTSGDPSQIQPLSGADQNSGGANGKCPGGPYCSTRDGSPSGNGNGNGKATGKPCAGCVGKADNKNPKGQYPNGSDHNAGYECDRNHGIGRTNPAHTGCQSGGGGGCDAATEDCGGGDCDAATEDCGGGDCDTATEDCGGGNDCDATTEDCGNPPPACVPTKANNFCSNVEGEHHTRKPPTKVLGEKVTKTPTVLPFTGAAGIGVMIGTAALAMAAGGGLMLASRRRRSTTS